MFPGVPQAGLGYLMPDTTKHLEISALYLELASECLNKAGTAKDDDAADALRRMGRSYFVQAVALNPSLGRLQPEFPIPH
jgi:hypothetical protein